MAGVCAVASAHAEKRVALVVGNGEYRFADKVANPVNDALGMSDALKSLGFDVVDGKTLYLKGMMVTIGQFAGLGRRAEVVVYFAGHGATFGDTSYFVRPANTRDLTGRGRLPIFPVRASSAPPPGGLGAEQKIVELREDSRR